MKSKKDDTKLSDFFFKYLYCHGVFAHLKETRLFLQCVWLVGPFADFVGVKASAFIECVWIGELALGCLKVDVKEYGYTRVLSKMKKTKRKGKKGRKGRRKKGRKEERKNGRMEKKE